MRNWKVSPSHDMESLRSGKVQPVDVFEDAIQGWLLNYAAKLAALDEPHVGMAIMALISAYPETIECYSSGTDSKGKSRDYFRKGLKRILPELKDVPDDALDSICDDLRNGLYHASMLKGRIVLTPEGSAIDYCSDERVFTVNPFEFFRRVQSHFKAYVRRLRTASGDDEELKHFLKYWDLRHKAEEVKETSSGYLRSAEDQVAGETVLSTAAPIDARRFMRRM